MKKTARFITIGALVILACLVGLLANQLRLKENGIAQASMDNVTLQNEIQQLKQELAVPPSSKLRNFKSLEELQAFLVEDKTDELEYTRHQFDCEDFSVTLTKNAMDAGYWIYTTLWWGCQHQMNMAWVECEDGITDCYLIEPDKDLIIYAEPIDKLPDGVVHEPPPGVILLEDTKYGESE